MPPRDTSLFQGVLGGQLDLLLDDVQRNAANYAANEQQLLQELSAGRSVQSLRPEERFVLDQATISYAAATKPVLKAPKPKAPPVKPKALVLGEPMEDARAPQVETPRGPMPGYWWMS